jgi:hypothetical protein
MENKKPMSTIRLSTKKIDEPLLNGCSRDTRLVYFLLYILAGKCNQKGRLIKDGITLDERKIAHYIHVEKQIVSASIEELKICKKVGFNEKSGVIKLLEFDTEQVDVDKKRKLARLRQRAHRERISSLNTLPG